MRRKRLKCRNLAPFIIQPFPLPHRLHRPNLCRGKGINPQSWRNRMHPTTSWWRTLRPFSILWWRNPHETHWGGIFFERTSVFERRFESSNEDSNLRTKIRIFERRFEFEDCLCFNRNSIKSNRIQAAGENCRKSVATAARTPD